MSQFTSIKIKINERDSLATLLSEYRGDFEIKVWILDKEDSWTGELSSAEAQKFISHYKITKEIFIEELQRALTTSDPEVSYFINKDEDKGYVLSWKKCLDTGITIKSGEMTLQKVSSKDIYDEVLERSFEHNAQLQSQIIALQKERENLLKEKDMVVSSLEKVVKQKENFEKNVYSQFLSVLNAKKERIAELRESLDAVMVSKAASFRVKEEEEEDKKEVKKEAPKRSKKDASKRPQKEVPKQSQSEASKQSQGESSLEEELDPFEVDTDVEDDSPCPRRMKRELSETGSQSFSLDNPEEVSSPVPVLPKRSKAEVKRPEKKSTEKDIPKEDLFGQL